MIKSLPVLIKTLNFSPALQISSTPPPCSCNSSSQKPQLRNQSLVSSRSTRHLVSWKLAPFLHSHTSKMEDWEDEEIPKVISTEQKKSKWDDEDVDENDVKDSWEDEDEPSLAPVENPPEKPAKKPAPKSRETKGNTMKVAKQESLDPVAEKLRQQRLVEEADYKSTAELFAKKGDEKTLDTFIPKSESDFLEYAELVSHKLRPYEKSYHYISLLKLVMRLSMTSLKAADAKDVASSISAIANEKLKAEKEANTGKKKTGGKKKQLHVDKPDDDVVFDHYDALDDYDFM